jgi:hypothetical protein
VNDPYKEARVLLQRENFVSELKFFGVIDKIDDAEELSPQIPRLLHGCVSENLTYLEVEYDPFEFTKDVFLNSFMIIWAYGRNAAGRLCLL